MKGEFQSFFTFDLWILQCSHLQVIPCGLARPNIKQVPSLMSPSLFNFTLTHLNSEIQCFIKTRTRNHSYLNILCFFNTNIETPNHTMMPNI